MSGLDGEISAGQEAERVALQFFLMPEERFVGVAESIIRPASWATSIRRSCISWKLTSAIAERRLDGYRS